MILQCKIIRTYGEGMLNDKINEFLETICVDNFVDMSVTNNNGVYTVFIIYKVCIE